MKKSQLIYFDNENAFNSNPPSNRDSFDYSFSQNNLHPQDNPDNVPREETQTWKS